MREAGGKEERTQAFSSKEKEWKATDREAIKYELVLREKFSENEMQQHQRKGEKEKD